MFKIFTVLKYIIIKICLNINECNLTKNKISSSTYWQKKTSRKVRYNYFCFDYFKYFGKLLNESNIIRLNKF